MNFRTLPPAEWPTLAPFLQAQNVGAALCLHSHAGDTVAAYQADLARLSPDETRFVVAEQNARCVGVMGVEFNVETARAWLRGPLIAASLSAAVADEMRDALWTQLDEALPDTLKRFNGFLEISNVSGLAWYERHGFQAQPHYFIYEARRAVSASAPTMPDNVHAASPAHHASLLELAHLVFPAGYLSPSELTADNTDNHALFVITEGSRVDGYVYANIADAAAGVDDVEVYVDYLVVRPEARGRGYGRTLLQAALSWGFTARGAGKAALSVAANNANAQSLYASVGFALAVTGAPMRLDRA